MSSPTLRPHRGLLILILGILGIVMSCFPLGIMAWVMGNSDLAAMQRGELDPSGHGTTNAGRVLGIVGVVLSVLSLLLFVMFGGLAAMIAMFSAAN